MHLRKTILGFCAGLLLAGPCSARTPGLHWERLHVTNAEPSELLQRLGLTHITRYGHTLGQKHIPDPTFPPGLTDVVPYDPGHTLLVRGTTQGVALFRRRVAAADVPEPHWQIVLTLSQPDPAGDEPALSVQNREITAETPLVVSFDADGRLPQYQITVRLNRDGTLAVTRRTALSLSPSPDVSSPGTAVPSAGVFVPTQVWTAPITEDMRLGDTLTFSDLAADRAAALQQLGPAGTVQNTEENGDYQVQLQVSADAAPTSTSGVAP